MKITLDSLDGQKFALRIPRDDGREHLVSLHTTQRLRGVFEMNSARINLDPVEADALVGEIVWQLAQGSAHLGGPFTCGATHFDVDFARGDHSPATTGEARCASLAVPVTRVTQKDLDVQGALEATGIDAAHEPSLNAWNVSLEDFIARALVVAQPAAKLRAERVTARPLSARSHAGALSLTIPEVVIEGFTASFGETVVTLGAARLGDLRVTRDASGALVVEVGEATLTDIDMSSPRRSARSAHATLSALRYTHEDLSVATLDVGELSISVSGLGEEASADEPQKAPRDEAAAPRDLSLLDLLEGRLEADIQLDMRLPVIQRRVATHKLRLGVSEGTIDYKDLEHGLSLLEDAILDFEIDNNSLVLVLDAVLIKKPLMFWALDDAGVARARGHRIRLRTLVNPTLPQAPRDAPAGPKGDGGVGINRVRVDAMRADLVLGGPSTLRIGGGCLRLGTLVTPAIGSLRVRGAIGYDPGAPSATTEVSVELAAVDLGADEVPMGERLLSVGRATLGATSDAVVTFRGPAPAAVEATLREVAVRSLVLALLPLRLSEH